jgi:hypothetical protein
MLTMIKLKHKIKNLLSNKIRQIMMAMMKSVDGLMIPDSSSSNSQ